MTDKINRTIFSAMETLLEENFYASAYSLSGYKESACCLEKDHAGWNVYTGERNNQYDLKHYGNLTEAFFDMLNRLCVSSEEEEKIKDAFFEKIVRVA
ncbi:hypothetical protein [Clostridium vitabionis]|uniref:hypothetical protein n=1 Tax=Clostridium vitabionis TaxID=2784388 RepID=UPI00188A52E1|nr:hypothetical protein [Clostridium vitabionis]